MLKEKLCFSCKEIRGIVYVDAINRGYCAECIVDNKVVISSVARAMGFLSSTIPFKVGDRVEARMAGELYDGIGTVTEVCFDLKHGGTPVIPTFKVLIDEPADDDVPEFGWYCENGLTLVAGKSAM